MSNGAFTAARTREFTALLARYGTTFTSKGTPYVCIANPLAQTTTMRKDNYQEEIPGEFTMWLSDFNASGITFKSAITHGGNTYEVFTYQTDDQEPTVILRANRKQ